LSANELTVESGSVPTPAPARVEWADVPLHAWVQVGVLAALFIALHWNLLAVMGAIARRDPDWSHAFLVPAFSLYFVHQRRQAILAADTRTCWWGLPVFLVGLAAHFLSIFPVRSIMFQGYTMIVEILGLVLLMLGPKVLKLTAFPVAYLVFGIKFSSRVWNVIAWRMQLIAAKSAVVLMTLFGVDAEVKGSTIELWRGAEYLGALNVAEACSGLRMLIAFSALGVAIVYLVPRPWWARLTLLVLTVPIAIAVNVLRVTITGFLHLVNPELSAGDFHTLIGMLMVFPAVALFLLVGWVLDHLFVAEEDDAAAADGRPDAVPPPGEAR